jgi:PAS domain S-box-containing protein
LDTRANPAETGGKARWEVAQTMHRLRVWFKTLSPGVVAAICLALIVLFTALDLFTPLQVVFTLFYALVVALASWAAGRRVGAAVAVIGALAASVDEWINWNSSADHVDFWMPCWNTGVRCGIFLFISQLSATVRGLTDTLEQRVRLRTAELEKEIGNRAESEARLQESALRFRQLAESIAAVFWMSNPDRGQILYVSPAYERVWGRPCQSLYDSPPAWRETIHPEDRERVVADILARQVSGRYDEEYRIERPDGQVRWVRDRAFPIRDEAGKVIRIAGIAEDITEQKTAEAALRDSENRYRSLVEAARDVIFTTSNEHTITSLNAAFETMTGWRREEWIGRSFVELVLPEDLPLAVAMSAHVALGESMPVFEVRVRTKPGGFVVAQVSGTPQFKDGKVLGGLGIARDITEGKQRQEELQTQAKVLESMAEGLVVTDGQGLVVLINPAARKLWGYAPEELKGRHVTVLSPLPETQAKEFFSTILKEVESRGMWSGEFENVSKEGRRFFTQAVITRLESGGRTLLVSLQQDVTEKRRAEERLRTQGQVLNNMTEGVVLVDENGVICLTNPGLDAQFGCERGELVGKPVTVLLRDQSAESGQRVAEITNHANTHGMWHGELPNRRKDGSLFVSEVRMSRLEIGGKPFVIGVGQDITERKQAEQRLHEALELNRTMIAASALGISAYKASGQCVFANEALSRITNGRVEQHLKQNFRRLESWQRCGLLGLADEALRQNQVKSAEIRMVTSFGKEVWGEFYLAPFVSGGESHLLCMMNDTSDRKRAEETLQTQGRVLDSMFEGVSLVDEQGVIRLTNPALDAMFGYERGELLGKHVTVLNNYAPEENARIAADIIERVTTHGAFVGEFQNRRKDGTPFACEARICALNTGDKRFFVSVQQDITERKRLESQILEVSDREQARIGQDLHDGLCQELVSAGFDINQLEQRLAALSLPETKIAGQIAAIVDAAITEARAIARGLFPVQLEADGLSAALQELAANVSARSRVDCRAHCPGPALVRDNAVATHLYRIAQEAVSNALKHSQAKSISIRLSTVDDRIELSVADDGIGISTPPQSVNGMGLHIMNYRARTIGGTLSIGRAPASGGTVVCCCAPQQTA